MPEDDHVTLGVRFRTPSPPEIATAIGRAIYNFLSLEGQVAALLVDAGESDRTESRKLMAGEKANRLRRAAKRYDRGGDTAVAQALRAAAKAFDSATRDERNALAHASLFAANRTPEGEVEPGLAMTDGEGNAILATSAEEILDMASRIEAAREPVAAARRAARAALPISEPKFEYETSEGVRVSGTLDSLRRLAGALLLASADMPQVAAACDMLEAETEDPHRAGALEAALVVCYARAFTQSTLHRLPQDAFAPRNGTKERDVHDILMTLRDKAYAHTDEESGRSVSRLVVRDDGETAIVEHDETRHALDRDLLDRIRALCAEQETKLRLEGVRVAGAVAKASDASGTTRS